MLLPDKHISLAESLVGLGGFLLAQLDRPVSVDELHKRVIGAERIGALPAYHDFDAVLLAVLFLYAIAAVELTADGDVRRCVS